jgi:hypothetical protein
MNLIQRMVRIIGHWVESEFSPKRLDKPTSQAKIPPISGKLTAAFPGRP